MISRSTAEQTPTVRGSAAGMARPAPAVAAPLAAVVLLVAGCSGASASSSAAQAPATQSTATIKTATVAGLGRILVDAKGRTVYMFPPDHQRSVTCTSRCAAVWPPVTIADHATPTAGPGVHADLLGSVPNPGGGRVVTYHGWPLYTYIEDSRPGQATGQALDRNGGLWYVISPSGTVIE